MKLGVKRYLEDVLRDCPRTNAYILRWLDELGAVTKSVQNTNDGRQWELTIAQNRRF